MKALSMTLTIALTIFAVNSNAAARKSAHVKPGRQQAPVVAQQNSASPESRKPAECPLKKMRALLRDANTTPPVAKASGPNRPGSSSSAVSIKN